MGYSPWGRKELDMTERLSTAHMILQMRPNNGKFPVTMLPNGLKKKKERNRRKENV